jgi:hypothetical protein
MSFSMKPWPASERLLQQWIAQRALSGAVTGTTIESYLSALRSEHIDRRLLLQVFDTLAIKRLIRGAKSINSASAKRDRLPILPPILGLIVFGQSRDDCNVNAAITLAFAAFLRLGEITYDKRASLSQAFASNHVTRSDVCLASDHLVLRLKRSKTDYEHRGIAITVAATALPTCPVSWMRKLFASHPAPPAAPLFAFR